jgi:uncharacterized protein (TIGR03085 family)
MSVTHDERLAMCELLDELGPDRPTLCGDWTTRDLLAHLLVRERRPDASLGIVIPAFAGRTEAAMRHVAEQSFTENVETFRHGPPIWMPWAIPILGDRANLFEFYVHHEDIRRAQVGWAPRPSDGRREDALWGALTMMGRLLFRHSPVGVVLRAAGRDDAVVRKGAPSVHIVGEPSEIALVAFGRSTDLTRVVVQGEPDDVARFEASSRGL